MTNPFDFGQHTGRVGKVIRGTYRLVRLLGKGGMGEVYEAEHTTIPRRFAVKLLAGNLGDDGEVLLRFHREATIAASLGSPHIVEVYDFNQAEDGTFFMAMELLLGETLGARLSRQGPMTPEAWLPLFSEICEGLEVAHSAGIVHRDLKPDNLFLARGRKGEEVLKILDFGISKIRSSKTMQTRAGSVLGTPNYMSPEQAEGLTAEADQRTDIFSLGAIVYEALTCKLAFDGPTLPAIMMKICYTEPEPLTSIGPQLPPGVVAAVSRALSKAPADRFPDVGSFLDAYRAALSPAAQPAAGAAICGTSPPKATPKAIQPAIPQAEQQVSGSYGLPSGLPVLTPLPDVNLGSAWASGPAEVLASQQATPGKGEAHPALPPAASPQLASPPVASPPVASPPVASPPVASPPVASPPVASPPVASPQLPPAQHATSPPEPAKQTTLSRAAAEMSLGDDDDLAFKPRRRWLLPAGLAALAIGGVIAAVALWGSASGDPSSSGRQPATFPTGAPADGSSDQPGQSGQAGAPDPGGASDQAGQAHQPGSPAAPHGAPPGAMEPAHTAEPTSSGAPLDQRAGSGARLDQRAGSSEKSAGIRPTPGRDKTGRAMDTATSRSTTTSPPRVMESQRAGTDTTSRTMTPSSADAMRSTAAMEPPPPAMDRPTPEARPPPRREPAPRREPPPRTEPRPRRRGMEWAE